MAWGKCTINVTGADTNNSSTTASVVPADGTTTLNVTEGDKTEAKEEGGGVVAVKYAKNTYELQFATREKLSGISSDDGVITGNWKIVLTPEEQNAPKLTISKAHMTLVESFSSADGWLFTYKCAALRVNNSAAITIAAGS